MEWKDTDPRFDIYKRACIIILRPDGYEPRACLGHVETKHSWCVSTEFEDKYCWIGSGDDWPEGWKWVGV